MKASKTWNRNPNLKPRVQARQKLMLHNSRRKLKLLTQKKVSKWNYNLKARLQTSPLTFYNDCCRVQKPIWMQKLYALHTVSNGILDEKKEASNVQFEMNLLFHVKLIWFW